MTEFEEIIAENYTQREMDEAEAAAVVADRLNRMLDGLPPEGEWLS